MDSNSNLQAPAHPGGYSIFNKAYMNTASSNPEPEGQPGFEFDETSGHIKLEAFPVLRLSMKTKKEPEPEIGAKRKKVSVKTLSIVLY
ncbi:unnamed protein product [Timema podura]|uniref:Uncharacterized protein n=1 Tax=Timema podura TaxID=61482 RepID=A0ABN7NMM1_TIMPD|nr:unnamed protein product [Timema podura]